MKKELLIMSGLVGAVSFLNAGNFAIQGQGETFSVKFQGETLISGEKFTHGFGASHTYQEPGIYNRYDLKHEVPYRREVGLRNAGKEVEITFQMNVPAFMKSPKAHAYYLEIPFKTLEGMQYEALVGRSNRTFVRKGTITANSRGNFVGEQVRQIALWKGKKQLVFDFNCCGVGSFMNDYDRGGRSGRWTMYREGDKIVCATGTRIDQSGAVLSSKVVIYEGSAKDFSQRHAHRNYSYYSALPYDARYVFGAQKFGKGYSKIGQTPYQNGNKAGWVKPQGLKLDQYRPQGALYSAVQSQQTNVFKMNSKRDGVHLLTLMIGTGNQPCGPMTIKCNGKTIVENLNIPAKTAQMVAFPVWIEQPAVELEFSGNWRISTVSDQVLLTSAEDVTFRRGYWLSKLAKYPSPMLNSEYYAKEPQFKTALSSYPLPEPGQECAAPRKSLANPNLHAQFAPGKDWRGNFKLGSLGISNSGTFTEYASPENIARIVDQIEQNNYNVILSNGMLSRHTYPDHQDRVRQVLKSSYQKAHEKNIKCIDHIDYEMLWNCDSGFRVLVENLDTVQYTIDGMMPARARCPVNPAIVQKFYDDVLEHVKAIKADGLMVDEFCFLGADFCGCAECRKKFKADTNWELPADELSPHLNNNNSPLWAAWREWRRHQIGEFWLGLRQKIQQYRKDFVFIGYTTHYGLISSWASNDLAQDIIQTSRVWDLTGTEIMSRNVFESYRSIYALRKVMNMFKTIYNIPSFGLVYANDWDLKYFGWALNNMCAQATWEGKPQLCPAGKSNYQEFLTKNGNMDALTAQSAAKIALLFSVTSRHCNKGSNYHSEILGISQYLNSIHVNHDFISEVGLKPEILKNYQVIIVGNSPAISDQDLAKLFQFAEQGGKVYFGYMSGRYNELGQERPEYFLKARTGLNSNWNLSARKVGAVGPNRKNQPLLADQTIYARPVTYSQVAQDNIKLWFKDGGNPRRITPALLEFPCGKGKIYYSPLLAGSPLEAQEAMVGRKLGFELKNGCEQILGAVLAPVIAQADVWTPRDIPSQVLTAVYRIPEGYCLHFLNATGAKLQKNDLLRATMPAHAFPTLKSNIQFEIAPGKCGKVYAVSPDFKGEKTLKFEQLAPGKILITLPAELLKVYTLVYVK